MVLKEKKGLISEDAKDLWQELATPIPLKKYVKEAGTSEKILVFSETGAGKTSFYLGVLKYLEKNGLDKKDLKMYIVFPDRPNGLAMLYGMIPKKYIDCIHVLPVSDYEGTIRSTATAQKGLIEHYEQTGVHGWTIFELMENYWTFAQDYFCRQAYGQTITQYFTQMQSIMKKEKADKKTAYEAFAGPFGGPWPIIKFTHNFNWIDRVKRFPFNIVFTSELKEETNEDSVFKVLGYRPAGEKHTQHKVDTILYLKHTSNNFYMKPYKLTGYRKLYGEINITGKDAYPEHKNAIKRLRDMGYAVTKIDDLEEQAGIEPPKPPKKPKQEKPDEDKPEEEIVEETDEEKTEEVEEESDDIFSI